MARRLGALCVVLVLAGLLVLFARDRSKRTLRTTSGEIAPAAATGDAPAVPPTPAQDEVPAPGRAVIRGIVRYPDGSGALDRHVELLGPSTLWTDTGEDGRFGFRDAEPGGYAVVVDGADLQRFQIAAGETRDLDLEIARGRVRGTVLDADTGDPIDEIGILLGPERWSLGILTGRNGRFEFPAVPPGTHTLVALDAASSRRYSEPLSAYGTQAAACPVAALDIDLTLRLRRARPLHVRFEEHPRGVALGASLGVRLQGPHGPPPGSHVGKWRGAPLAQRRGRAQAPAARAATGRVRHADGRHRPPPAHPLAVATAVRSRRTRARADDPVSRRRLGGARVPVGDARARLLPPRRADPRLRERGRGAAHPVRARRSAQELALQPELRGPRGRGHSDGWP